MEVNFWISRIYYYCGAALARPDDAGGTYKLDFYMEREKRHSDCTLCLLHCLY